MLMVKITADKIIADYNLENKQEDSSFFAEWITLKCTILAKKLNCI